MVINTKERDIWKMCSVSYTPAAYYKNIAYLSEIQLFNSRSKTLGTL